MAREVMEWHCLALLCSCVIYNINIKLLHQSSVVEEAESLFPIQDMMLLTREHGLPVSTPIIWGRGGTVPGSLQILRAATACHETAVIRSWDHYWSCTPILPSGVCIVYLCPNSGLICLKEVTIHYLYSLMLTRHPVSLHYIAQSQRC